MSLADNKVHTQIIDGNDGFDKEEADNVFAFELQKIIQQETHGGARLQDDVLAEAIATVDVDLPDLSNASSPGLLYGAERNSHAQTNDTSSDLTVEHILGDLKSSNDEDRIFTERLNSLLCLPDTGAKRLQADDTKNDLPVAKKQKSVYETLSPPESMSPLSDKNDISHSKVLPTNKSINLMKRKINSQKMLKQVPLPPKLTNEFTMTQVAEMKKRIINTHKLLLNFNFLKDGYARTCEELSKTVVKLKDSEFDRARLVKENQDLKRLVLELSKKQTLGVGKSHDEEAPME